MQPPPAKDPSSSERVTFELPASVPPEDLLILEHILTALQSFGEASASPCCVRYRVRIVEGKGYLLHATLPHTDPFELTLDDLLFLRSTPPRAHRAHRLEPLRRLRRVRARRPRPRRGAARHGHLRRRLLRLHPQPEAAPHRQIGRRFRSSLIRFSPSVMALERILNTLGSSTCSGSRRCSTSIRGSTCRP